MQRRILIVIAIVIALVAVGWIYRTQSLAHQTTTTNTGREAVVRLGTLLSTIKASGSIEPEAQVALNFGTPGTVAEIYVRVGQPVRAGDLLARLDTTELELAVAQAEKTYLIQQLTYSQTIAGPKPADVAAAQAQLNSAWAQYNDLKKGPKPDQLAQAEVQLTQARNQLTQAQKAHERTLTCVTVKLPTGEEQEVCPGLGPAEEQARLQLEIAQASFQAAQAAYDRVAAGAGDASLQAAWAQVQQAQANLARLTPDTERIQIARLQMEQAKISYEQARQRLKNATLVAPFDGTVTQVNLTRGATVSASSLTPAIVLTDLSRFHVTVDIDEIDVGQLQVGQTVSATAEALPGQTFTGQVDRIAPVATIQGGIVSYQVTIALNPTDLPLRAGMSVNLSIVTQALENVLLVPNWAIRLDRATGQAYVNLKEGQTIREVEIVTGPRNENDSQVLAGLSEGDVVITGGVEKLTTMLESMSNQ